MSMIDTQDALTLATLRRCAELTRDLEASRAREERLLAALLNLANAADEVGVRFFDTDTMEPEVETMQAATQTARAALSGAATPTPRDALTRGDLARLSRAFGWVSDLRTEEDRRVNDWLKRALSQHNGETT